MSSYSIFAYLAFFFLASSVCDSFNRKVLYATTPPYSGNGQDYENTIATFYGEKDGPGSLGGSCGYETAVQLDPYNSRIAAVHPSLYEDGVGCGVCYLITCAYQFCSGVSVRVIATDLCPEGACTDDHLFDLSGAAVEDLANPGQEDQLRQIGDMQIQYKRTPCAFQAKVGFRVDPGSGGEYFATAIEFQNGGEISRVDVRDANSTDWVQMDRSWGAVFKVLSARPFLAPLSFRLNDNQGSPPIEAINVIPADYDKDKTYVSNVNFKD